MRALCPLCAVICLLAGAPAAAAPGPVLLVLAHPDDETMLGGTLGRLKELGCPVHAIYITRGEGGKRLVKTGAGLKVKKIAPAALARIRRRELKAAARRFGISRHHQLRQPDVPLREGTSRRPSRDAARFLAAKIWDVPRIEREISARAVKLAPRIVITTLPRHRAIHAHHQSAARIVLGLFRKGKLGPRAEQIYGVLEVDWYDKKTFPPDARDVRWPRARRSVRLGMTYGQFFARGSAAHASQRPGHIARTDPRVLRSVEALRPLTRHRAPDPLRRLLGAPR